MYQPVLRRSPFDSSRLHETTAPLCPISRININVLAPKTHWAMIGESCAFYNMTTVFAGKVFYYFFENHMSEYVIDVLVVVDAAGVISVLHVVDENAKATSITL
jgi:hypothetical protein